MLRRALLAASVTTPGIHHRRDPELTARLAKPADQGLVKPGATRVKWIVCGRGRRPRTSRLASVLSRGIGPRRAGDGRVSTRNRTCALLAQEVLSRIAPGGASGASGGYSGSL
jgi:hypothetical protein